MNTQNHPRPSRPLVANVFGAVVAAAALLGWPLGASAADQVVLNTADAGAGSLRQAIADATAGDSITFAPDLAGTTITLTSGQLLLNKSLSIDASALTGGIAVSGNNASRVFEVAGGQTTAEFIGLTITGGQTTGNGGGILNFNGTLVLTDTTLSGKSADQGGGVWSVSGALTVNRCRVTGNTAASDGGGLYCRSNSGAINIIDTTISGNAATTGGGGGLFERFNVGVTTISRSTLSANSAVFGAGVFSGDGVLEMANSTIADNATTTNAGGGIYLNSSTTTLSHVTIAGNRAPASGGGGMVVANAAPIGLTLNNSIIAGNSASFHSDIW